MEMQFKMVTFVTKAIDPEAGIYELMPSTEGEDRDKDILLAAGAQLDNFRKNPVVLYAHDYGNLPVAKANTIEAIPGTGLKATIQFPMKGIYDKADTVRGLWAGGFLNAASVGFIPNKFEARPGPNGELPEDSFDSWFWPYGKIFTSWELLEFSIVPVPANADALRLGYGMSKRGRVLSAANEKELRAAHESIGKVLAQLDQAPEEDEPGKAIAANQMSELAASLADINRVLRGA
jgi:hypothetical protein